MCLIISNTYKDFFANLTIYLGFFVKEGLSVALDASPLPILADLGQLEQVFANLVLNARDAMQGGGEITILSDFVEISEGESRRHQQLKAGPYVRCVVRDDGEGMSAEILAEIFEPFFTTKAFGKGTGLGLSSAYGIVKQHKGHIHVRSELGQGTEVELLFPRSSDAGTTGQVSSEQITPMVTDALRQAEVLVVEDEGFVRRYTVRILRGAGFFVHDVGKGEEALDFLQARAGQVDILLSDVVMSGMSGPELVEQVRAQYPQIKALLMSGYPRDELRSLGFSQNFADFVEKPFTPEELIAALRGLLPRERS